MGCSTYRKRQRFVNKYDGLLKKAIYKVNRYYQDMDVNECRNMQYRIKNMRLR